MLQGVDPSERIAMKLPLNIFNAEAKEFAQHNLDNFFKSSYFLRDYKLEGNMIVPHEKV